MKKWIEFGIVAVILFIVAMVFAGCEEEAPRNQSEENMQIWKAIKTQALWLQRLDAEMKQWGKTFDFYIDPNDNTDAIFYLPEGSKAGYNQRNA